MEWLIVVVLLLPSLALAIAIGIYIFTAAMLGSSRQAAGRCAHCGYDLRGHARQDRCPECGKPFDFELKKPSGTKA